MIKLIVADIDVTELKVLRRVRGRSTHLSRKIDPKLLYIRAAPFSLAAKAAQITSISDG